MHLLFEAINGVLSGGVPLVRSFAIPLERLGKLAPALAVKIAKLKLRDGFPALGGGAAG